MENSWDLRFDDMSAVVTGAGRAVAERLPLGRVSAPADVTGAVLFLCSPISGYMTGQLVVVDGGRLCRSG